MLEWTNIQVIYTENNGYQVEKHKTEFNDILQNMFLVIIDKCVFENSKCILNIKPRVDNTTSASLIKVSDTLFIYGQSELVMLNDINSFTKVTFSNVTFENNSANYPGLNTVENA